MAVGVLIIQSNQIRVVFYTHLWQKWVVFVFFLNQIPTGRTRISPWVNIDEEGNIIRNPENFDLIEKYSKNTLIGKIKRREIVMNYGDDILNGVSITHVNKAMFLGGLPDTIPFSPNINVDQDQRQYVNLCLGHLLLTLQNASGKKLF